MPQIGNSGCGKTDGSQGLTSVLGSRMTTLADKLRNELLFVTQSNAYDAVSGSTICDGYPEVTCV